VPPSAACRKRFCDSDLNRQFRSEDLANPGLQNHEQKRAKELNSKLGPKAVPETDLVIDLHSTTSNMGMTLIVEGDDFLMLHACQHIMDNWTMSMPIRVLWENLSRQESPHLSSLGRHGFIVEVGPVATGLVRHESCEATREVLTSLLGFCEGIQMEVEASGKVVIPPRKLAVFEDLGVKIPPPQDSTGRPLAVVHPSIQDRDWEPVRVGDPIFEHADGSVIPYNHGYGEVMYPIFVSESGYQFAESGMGFGVSVKRDLELPELTVTR
jgi:succinylglutamate desuccinylase